MNVNLTQALGEAVVKSNETFRRNVPGDTLRFHLRLEDRLLDGRYPSGDPTALWAALSGLSSAGLGLLAWWRRK